MKISVERDEGVCIIFIDGEVDALTCGELDEKINGLLQDSVSRIVLDMKDVSYVSSAGLRVILATAQRLHGKGRFVISRTSENVRSILEMVGLATIISICSSLSEAREKVLE